MRREVADGAGGEGALAPGVTLLEASAGTGKTHRIAHQFLRLVIAEGVPVDRILVVTYTEAATAELRDRIRRRLREALAACEPEDDGDPELVNLIAPDPALARARIEHALNGFDEAAISTIHGFCHRTLRENAFESGADFEAELVADAGDLLREVVEDFWIRSLHDAPVGFVRHLARRGVNVRTLLELARKVAADPDLTIEPAASPAEDDGAADAWRAAFEAARAAWRAGRDAALETFWRACEADALHQRLRAPDRATLEGRAAVLDAWFAAPREPGEPPAGLRAFCACEIAARTRKGMADHAPRHPVFDRLHDLHRAADALAAELDARALALKHALIAFVRDALPRRKRARRVQAFDDLLGLLRDALRREGTGDALAAAVRGRYDAALIDEFQDTDPIQWEIFRRIFRGGDHRLQLIGDPKQAIYAFRRADVFTYLAARETADRREDLDVNHRADGRLVRAVNHLFGARRGGPPFVYEGIPFRPVRAHHAADRLRFPGGPVAPLEIRLLRGDPGRPLRKTRLHEDLPARVAADIAAFLASGAEIDDGDGAWRRVVAADVAVLVRTHDQAHAVQRALRAAGIPAVLHGADSVFTSREATELARVLGALASPAQMSRVRAALATDLLGVTADELAAMETDEAAWETWLERIRAWRELWIARGFMRLFRALLADLRLPERLAGLDDGERRLTNLLHLAELIHAAAVARRLEPAGLVQWLERERAHPGSDQEARKLRLETDADAVEIVTVHASKGLQYPVVWCPYLWASGSDPDRRDVRWHRGHEAVLDVGLQAEPEHVAAARREQRAEDLRLLYVALTRAKHRCVVYWGLINQAGASALAYVLHRPLAGPPDGAAALAAAEARYKGWGGDDAALRADLRALVAGAEGCIAVTPAPLTAPAAPRYRPTEAPTAELRASTFDRPRPLDDWWRRTSFSALIRGDGDALPDLTTEPVHRLDDEPDEVDDLDDAPEIEIGPPLPDLPGGPALGTALHRVLEEHDFTERDPAVLRARVARVLARHDLDPEVGTDAVAAMLASALDTPLRPGGPRLRDIGPGDRLNELAFEFPLAGGLAARGAVARSTLAALLRAGRSPNVPADYPDRLARLPFAPLRGFMTGHIDLVFRHAGRWWLVDYKTNRLGDHAGCYAAERLPAAMAHRHYPLQYHLYTVALDRYLRWRQPGYDYDRHFGGVWYLFLRGMSPEAGPRRGVFFDRPARTLVEALSAALDDPGEPR